MEALLFERQLLGPNMNDFQSIIMKNNDIGPFEIHYITKLMETNYDQRIKDKAEPIQIGI